MSKTIKIKKGLDICLKGAPLQQTIDATSIEDYAVKPTDFIGMTPKLMVKEGDAVKAGTPLMYDKQNEGIRVSSPVSGTVKAIVRGEKRAILAVIITSDGKHESEQFTATDPTKLGKEEIINVLRNAGVLSLLRQRPFGTAANPDALPKAIFVSGFDSAPLAVDYEYMLQGRDADLQCGFTALSRIAKVHLSLNPTKNSAKWESLKNVEIHHFEGKHPAGLVGTQIAMIDPINKGEIVWTINIQDVATLGHLFATGEYCPVKMIALAGPVVNNPQYYKVYAGAQLCKATQTVTASNVRFISGNVLSGSTIAKDGFLGYYDNQVSVLEEGNKYDFMGWLMPGLKKYSASHTFLSGFFSGCKCGKKFLEGREINTGLHGSVRPLVVTGQYEKVMPLNIYPMQLIKACIIGDIDLMENLGIYEVEPEDFALCEFVDTSKTEIQTIIREGLEKIRKDS